MPTNQLHLICPRYIGLVLVLRTFLVNNCPSGEFPNIGSFVLPVVVQGPTSDFFWPHWLYLVISRPIWDNRVRLYTIVLPVPYHAQASGSERTAATRREATQVQEGVRLRILLRSSKTS